MSDFVISHEAGLRLGVFIGILTLMVLTESLWPRRSRAQKRMTRWRTNLFIVAINTAAMRLLFPIAAMGAAIWANQKGYGLLNLISAPAWLKILLSIIALDMLIYWQHLASHKIPILWALHKVHHADRDIDASTALRFHPLEIILSMLFKMVCVMALGASAIAVILFEILLNGCAIFNHANVKLPQSFDRALRIIIVTPDMHRVHHSSQEAETNRNYGFCLSIWDRLFASYKDQPALGHEAMQIGLENHQNDKPSGLIWSLIFPFRR